MKALITGASSGMGYNMAKELSKRGYDLIVVARRKDCLENLKKECQTKIEMIVLDLSIKNNVYELYRRLKDQKIDLLINNAGVGAYGKFADTELSQELNMINVNLIAVHILTKLFLRDMRKRNEGAILNVGSISGFVPGPLMSSYYASKAYIVRLTQAIAYELKKEKSKVKVGILCPGPVDTNFNDIIGIHFTTKPLSSEYVSKYAINKFLKGKVIIIPGFSTKLVYWMNKILPDSLLLKVNYMIQRGKRRNC